MFETLFNHYWWLMFPLAWLTFSLVKAVMRDEERRRVMRLVKSYSDQGKDVPPELLNLLKY